MIMSLVSLAVFDLLFLISACINTTIVMLHCVEELSNFKVWLPNDPVVAFSVFTSLGSGLYANSMLVTTFITVIRCLAVAHPSKYRNLLSWQTTVKIISMFTVLSLTSSILLLVFVEIPPKFDSNANTIRRSLLVFPERTLMKDIIYGTRDVFLPLASQIIFGICVVIMARYPRSASQFRLKLSKSLSKNDNSVIKDDVRDKKALTDESHSANLFGKELQAVQQMLLIAVVYSLCNMPKVVSI
ncbi:unnamed protein product [Lymnaea stagnalis]|uniref:G-protein coupled receptors family 1 profile domain-containing protein n=1 Tax=Lymnaea stagnalis TaxID=6523 RepID=A0AAV2I9L0_LYMST